MAWPRTSSTKENTLLKMGGGPLNDVYKILDGQNLALTKPERTPNFTTPMKFAHRTIGVGDALDNSHRTWLGMTGLDLTTDQFLDIPVITRTQTAEQRDTVVVQEQDQVLKNKRVLLSENHVTGSSATAGDLVNFQDIGSGVIELRRTPKGSAGQYPVMNPSATGFVWQTPGTDIGNNVITDNMISSHTSTKITITNKSQLNSQIAYLDATAWLTDAMVSTHTSTKISITNKTQLNNQIAYLDATSWLTDAMVAAHTSTKISITAKAQLNSQIAYLDATSWLTDAMVASHTSTKITITNKAQLNSNILYKDDTSSIITGQTVFDLATAANDPIYIKRSTNTVGNDVRIGFQMRDSGSNTTTYAYLASRIGVNTDLSETGYMDINLLNAGTMQQLFVFDKNQLSIGVTGARAVLDSSLITTSSKTQQFPNVAGTVINTGVTSLITVSMIGLG